MASVTIEEQFTCTICLHIFRNPTTIPCGHNFCLKCIKRFWDTSNKAECPLCKRASKPRPGLRVNIDLKNIVEQWFPPKSHKPRLKPVKPPSTYELLCDVCHQHEIRAVRVCLDCKKSFCEIHLKPHQKDPDLAKHTMMDPATYTSTRLCKKHNKDLTMFCEKDQKLVCIKCTESKHKHHNTITLDSKSQRVKSELSKAKAEFQQMIQERSSKVDEIQTSVELSRVNKEREIESSVQAFSLMISAFEQSQALSIGKIEQKYKEMERRAEDYVKELRQEIQDLQKRCNSLQYMENHDDSLQVIKSFPPLSAPPSTVDWSTVTMPTDTHSSERKDFSKLVDICHDLLKKLCADEVNKISQYAVDVTFDPVTAAGWLTVSPDKKKVSVSRQIRRHSLPDDPRRFDHCVSILGKQRFTHGKYYWVVQVGDKTDWDLGVARESINRKGLITVRPDSGYWAISRRKGGSLSACTGPSTPLHLHETPHKVGIFLDYDEGSVSFYDAEAKTHIYTYSGCGFSGPLCPYFNPCLQDSGKNAAPLVICPLEGALSQQAAATGEQGRRARLVSSVSYP
ncbi:E3 ubiquitin-protein ligase TRIM39-like [Betta splendens]|uniref:E3 ubiquitin-protein ligase TRIM39-like n=1 Tax=Betta splendens TaxID=158456 RepID=A0A6P7LG38_BETSP|nr:E3 ubiquitin-protein ligase TRIM39-like [Betta splendens]